jgi:hypothetical protein
MAKQYLRFLYGADDVVVDNICHPAADLWMLRAKRNKAALEAISELKLEARKSGVSSGVLGADLYFLEMRDGRIDPAFNLDGVYTRQRQVVRGLLYAVLSRNQEMLKRLVTDPGKVQIVGPAAASGDMDQYASVIEAMPVVRSSKPEDDAKTKTITYRVPISNEALSLTLIKDDDAWKIDTSKSVRVPLEFFFR